MAQKVDFIGGIDGQK